jgi:hypothetical protein
MAQSTMTVTTTKDVNLVALQAMLDNRSGQFLVTVHNHRITSIAAVTKGQSVSELLAGAELLVLPGNPSSASGRGEGRKGTS